MGYINTGVIYRKHSLLLYFIWKLRQFGVDKQTPVLFYCIFFIFLFCSVALWFPSSIKSVRILFLAGLQVKNNTV